MAVYFLSLKNLSRADGSSSVGAAAYRSGERLRDERTRKVYDHSERQDILHKEIILPAQSAALAPDWTKERAALWNAAENAERRGNARVAREYLVLLPHELDAERRIELARRFAGELSDRYGFGVDLAVHAPRTHAGSDPRNFHAHLLATTRSITAAGLGEKTEIEWHDVRRIRAGLGSSVNELLHVRRRWAESANDALAASGLDVRIDHRALSRVNEAMRQTPPSNLVPQQAPQVAPRSSETVGDVALRAALRWREMRDRGEFQKARENTRERGIDKDYSR
ncbi:MAG TPA: MobA/MobL family protein [Steroidobacteraceae bacterium]|jgi:ATP-dependent exoDNAse (exonuclease V) alpha subunit